MCDLGLVILDESEKRARRNAAHLSFPPFSILLRLSRFSGCADSSSGGQVHLIRLVEGNMGGGFEQPTFSLGEALKAQKALRAAAGLGKRPSLCRPSLA
jgi:hypothetical protein